MGKYFKAGYDIVIVESVGLGQSEVEIDNAVDILVLLVPPGGGDSLQATKKGIMEAADLILINKADGNLLTSAKHTKADYSGAMHFVRPKHYDWNAKVLMISAHTQLNLDKVESEIQSFRQIMMNNHFYIQKRTNQAKYWMIGHFRRSILHSIESNDKIASDLLEINNSLEIQKATPRFAAKGLLNQLHIRYKEDSDISLY